MKRLIFVDGSVRVIFHAVLVGSLWLLFAGHNQPGGGFVGGLVAGSAVALRYVAGGIDEVRSLTRFKPWTILGGGLLLSGSVAALPMLFGDPVLAAASLDLSVPMVGELHPSSTLAFDVGVYLLVVGLVLMVLEAFGDDTVDEHRHDLSFREDDGEDPEPEPEPQRADAGPASEARP